MDSDKRSLCYDEIRSVCTSFISERREIYTNEEINREILNKNPMCTGDEVIPEYLNNRLLVCWDGADDPSNPRNWPVWKRIMATIIICACTASQYMGGAIVTTEQHAIQEYFDTSWVRVQLGITLFVWGYGLGDLWFTPMSEMPLFRGRNPTYLACQFLYTVLQIPLALSTNLPGYLVLRFLSGIFASPPLSTTAATINDMWAMPTQTAALSLWVLAQMTGPYVGPLIGAALTLSHNFRYIFWCTLAVSGGILVLMVIFLPETSEQELLVRKAKKLRKETGDDRYLAPGEVLYHTQTPGAVLKEMFFKPIKMTMIDPVLFLIDIHVGLIYSTIYLYLEALPLVYEDIYNFNSIQLGMSFLPCVIGNVVGAFLYMGYVYLCKDKVKKDFEKVFGPSALVGGILFSIGMVLFGWLSHGTIHWVAGMAGNFLYGVGDFFIMQSYFAFIGAMYPPDTAGSAFASNNLVRAMMAGAFPLFGSNVYTDTTVNGFPVGWGCTILAVIGVLILPLPIFLTIRGKEWREHAKKKHSKQ